MKLKHFPTKYRIKSHLWKLAFLINQWNDIHGFCTNQIQGILIVNKLNMFPVDSFIIILLLFHFENVLDKELLKVLIGIVDTQLLKAEI